MTLLASLPRYSTFCNMPRVKVTLECACCGRKVTRIVSKNLVKRLRFCDSECQLKYNNDRKLEKRRKMLNAR